MTVLTESDYAQRELERVLYAQHCAEDTANTIRVALEGNLYRDEDGELVAIEDGEEYDPDLFEPVAFWEWVNEQSEVVCLFDKDGEPREVELLMQGGGPTCRTVGNEIVWYHGETGRAYVDGLHDALLDMQKPLELVKRNGWGY